MQLKTFDDLGIIHTSLYKLTTYSRVFVLERKTSNTTFPRKGWLELKERIRDR